jgi:putative transposase
MPRPKRICIPGLPHHVVQRGNNRVPTFYHDEDYRYYLNVLCKSMEDHGVVLHAYVLMTNHVHLLMSPTSTNGLSLTMQALGRRYVTHINKTYRRTGTLWEGRFKASVIDSDQYCLACYRYIELNPVRAGMVSTPAEYPWTSYRSNALGETNYLLTPHPLYLNLAATPEVTATRYRRLVEEKLNADIVDDIRYGSAKGLPAGSDKFKADIEKHLRRRLGDGKVGRPFKR